MTVPVAPSTQAAAPPRQRRAKPLWTQAPWLRALGSLKAAVVLIFALAAVCIVGMLVEGELQAAGARRYVYGTLWFNALFLALAANIAAAALVRYPWPKRLTGFVITHAGLIVLILGSCITRLWGIEGKMLLLEGQQSDRVILFDQQVLRVQLPDGTAGELGADGLAARVGEAPRRVGNSAWAVAVADYVPSSRWTDRYEPDPTGAGTPALLVSVAGANFGAQATWLAPASGDPRDRMLDMGMLAVDTESLSDAEAEAEWRSDGAADRAYQLQYVLDAGDGGRAILVRLPDGAEQRFAVQPEPGVLGTLADGATVAVERLVERAMVVRQPGGKFGLEERPDGQRGAGPAAVCTVTWDGGRQRHTVFADMPEFAMRRGHAVGNPDRRLVRLGVTWDGRFLARIHDPSAPGAVAVHELAAGEPLTTPWAGITVTVSRFLRSADHVREIAAVPPDPHGDPDHAAPAVRLHLVGPSGEGDAWMQFGDTAQVHVGDAHVRCAWTVAELPLGFTIKLLDFRKRNDPGATSAAAFESDVHITDPLRGRNEDVTISMNYPLEHGVATWLGLGWAFYQESYEILGDGLERSQLQAAYDPGYPVVMLGSLMIVSGIFTMFYVVPYFVAGRRPRRSAAAAGTAPKEAQ